MESSQPRRIFLITHPRTASNLLIQMLALEDQPDIAQHRSGGLGGYFFLPAHLLKGELGLHGKPIEEWSEVHKSRMKERLQECLDELERYLEGAERDGKIAFVKEHGIFLIEPTALTALVNKCESTHEHPWIIQVPPKYNSELTRSPLNQSFLPDGFLRTWLPTFLIRHPALVFPSHYRVMKDIKEINPELKDTWQLDTMMTFSWIRSLYDYWSEHTGKSRVDMDRNNTWPLILEADDVMLKPEVIYEFSKLIGLDATKLKFEWEPAAATDLDQSILRPGDIEGRLLSTLRASSGILLDKTSSNIDICVEAKKWRAEFGDEMGKYIERRVRAAMPDYEYMKARRMKA